MTSIGPLRGRITLKKGVRMITLAIVLGLGNPADTVARETTIDEVVVSSFARKGSKTAVKGSLASIDEHLLALDKVIYVE